jgi:hypothetical protein
MRLHDGQPDEARVWCMGSNHGRYYPGLEHFDSDQFTIILQQDQHNRESHVIVAMDTLE